ncbi:MAG TPA: hypothetical protein VNW06_00725 [Cytophagaceae bacterium]|jgi:hypothetical protein|nr:hypothetical protein [Cytophagaceae bacterium]
MKKIIFVIPIMLFVALFSCDDKSTTTTTSDSTKIATDTTLLVLKDIRDSSDKAWEFMIKSDDQKISDIMRLLQEISYCKKYNVLLLDSLNAAMKTMKDKRYKQLTMTSAEIDEYDAFTDHIIARVKYLGSTVKDIQEHPLAETLYADIASADNDIVRYRNLYDNFAFAYNDYLEANKKSLGDKAKDFQKLPVFRLPA